MCPSSLSFTKSFWMWVWSTECQYTVPAAGASPTAVWLDSRGTPLLPADMATGECIGMPELAVTLGELGDIGLHEDPPLVGPSSASASADFDFEVSSALGERVLRGKPVSKPLGRTRV